MSPLVIPLAAGGVDGVALAVLIVLFVVVTVLGFMAARFKRGDTLDSLDEWGLGGRKFGTWITWFLLGGDLYTAYTFIAVPAAMFATGAVAGFFAVPYTIILYPIIFIFMARLWSVSHRHGYVTTADFVRGRYDSRVLSLAVAVTGFVATMPYIALQLVGIQAVLDVVGLGGSGNWLAKDAPLLIAFVLLAAYTYTSGLRAPAVIAFVKDALIYLVIIVAIIYLPHEVRRLGAHLRRGAGTRWPRPTRPPASRPARSSRAPARRPSRATGPTPRSRSARRWRCSCTRTRSPRRCPRTAARRSGATPRSCRRTPSCWGCWPCSAGWRSRPAPSRSGVDGKPNPQLVIPQLFEDSFPSWFAGVAFAAVAIGALVPAAIMSIAAANTFTRNIYKEWIKPARDPRRGGQGLQARRRWWSRRSRWSSCSPWTSRTPSTSSCSAASGSCRRSRRSCSASTRAGSTGGRCSPAGPSAWSTARSRPTRWSTR